MWHSHLNLSKWKTPNLNSFFFLQIVYCVYGYVGDSHLPHNNVSHKNQFFLLYEQSNTADHMWPPPCLSHTHTHTHTRLYESRLAQSPALACLRCPFQNVPHALAHVFLTVPKRNLLFNNVIIMSVNVFNLRQGLRVQTLHHTVSAHGGFWKTCGAVKLAPVLYFQVIIILSSTVSVYT